MVADGPSDSHANDPRGVDKAQVRAEQESDIDYGEVLAEDSDADYGEADYGVVLVPDSSIPRDKEIKPRESTTGTHYTGRILVANSSFEEQASSQSFAEWHEEEACTVHTA